METLEKIQKGEKVFAELITECQQNKDFKLNFIRNPKHALEDYYGNKIELPKGKLLKVEDQTNKNAVYLNIPARPNLDSLELSDEELERVSGGWTWTIAAAYALYEIHQGAYDAGVACGGGKL